MTPLIGIKVKFDIRRRCCAQNEIAVISAGKGPHAHQLLCVGCGTHRGWLSKSTANWIATVIDKCGAPTEPIVLRRRAPRVHALA